MKATMSKPKIFIPEAKTAESAAMLAMENMKIPKVEVVIEKEEKVSTFIEDEKIIWKTSCVMVTWGLDTKPRSETIAYDVKWISPPKKISQTTNSILSLIKTK